MGGLFQSAFGGGRALLLGWLLPSAINVLIFGIVVVPRASNFQNDAARPVIFALAGTAVLGLMLAALQVPLYRILEGYLGWPRPLARAAQRRLLSRKHLLQNRIEAAELALAEDALSVKQRRVLRAFREHPVTGRFIDSDVRNGPTRLGLLEERLYRYPIDDRQVLPTRLGNAIRRFEEYGFDRFRLDTQTLWHELYAAAPDAVRKQLDEARTNVDFFICLSYGHLVVAVAAAVDLCLGPGRPWLVAGAAVGLVVLAALWYRVAVIATDDWAGAARALVNLGRHPLADALGLTLPATLAEERIMWAVAGRLARAPYDSTTDDIDPFRVDAEPSDEDPGTFRKLWRSGGRLFSRTDSD